MSHLPINNQMQQGQLIFAPTGPSIENFLTAINLLYNSKDQQTRNAADKYLVQFDKFQESWDISMKILLMPNLSDEVYFNSIQILKNKIKYDFGNYFENKEIINKLIQFLLENFETFTKKTRYILSNYCYCFALTLVFSGELFGEIMKECVKRLNNDNLTNIMSLLMLFNQLGDVYFDKQIVIDDQNRNVFDRHLDMIGKDVVAFINYIILKYSNETRELMSKADPQLTSLFKVLDCNLLDTLRVWLEFGLNQDTLISLKNENSAIIDFVFLIDQNLLSNQKHCICELLILQKENQLKDLGIFLFNKILPLQTTFYQSIENIEQDEASFFIDIFTTLVIYNIDQIYNEKQYDIIKLIIDLIKICPSYKIEGICEFWEAFSQYLLINQIAPREILAQFKSLFLQMILNCIWLIQFNDDIFRQLNLKKTKYLRNNDDYLNVIDYRNHIRNLFKNFAKEYTFELFYNDILLGEFNTTINALKQNPTEIKGWARLEALLFTFNCICKEANNVKDISFLKMLFNIILEIPTSFVHITRTVTYIIDDLSESLSKR